MHPFSDDENDVKLTPGLSRTDMEHLTPEARIKAFMINAQIAPFKVIVDFMQPTGFNEKQILELCQRVAVLVRGVWIVRRWVGLLQHLLVSHGLTLY